MAETGEATFERIALTISGGGYPLAYGLVRSTCCICWVYWKNVRYALHHFGRDYNPVLLCRAPETRAVHGRHLRRFLQNPGSGRNSGRILSATGERHGDYRRGEAYKLSPCILADTPPPQATVWPGSPQPVLAAGRAWRRPSIYESSDFQCHGTEYRYSVPFVSMPSHLPEQGAGERRGSLTATTLAMATATISARDRARQIRLAGYRRVITCFPVGFEPLCFARRFLFQR